MTYRFQIFSIKLYNPL